MKQKNQKGKMAKGSPKMMEVQQTQRTARLNGAGGRGIARGTKWKWTD